MIFRKLSKGKVVKQSRPSKVRVKVRLNVPGSKPDDIEVLFAGAWVTVSSIAVSENMAMFWRTDVYIGNCPQDMWRWK